VCVYMFEIVFFLTLKTNMYIRSACVTSFHVYMLSLKDVYDFYSFSTRRSVLHVSQIWNVWFCMCHTHTLSNKCTLFRFCGVCVCFETTPKVYAMFLILAYPPLSHHQYLHTHTHTPKHNIHSHCIYKQKIL